MNAPGEFDLFLLLRNPDCELPLLRDGSNGWYYLFNNLYGGMWVIVRAEGNPDNPRDNRHFPVTWLLGKDSDLGDPIYWKEDEPQGRGRNKFEYVGSHYGEKFCLLHPTGVKPRGPRQPIPEGWRGQDAWEGETSDDPYGTDDSADSDDSGSQPLTVGQPSHREGRQIRQGKSRQKQAWRGPPPDTPKAEYRRRLLDNYNGGPRRDTGDEDEALSRQLTASLEDFTRPPRAKKQHSRKEHAQNK